MHDTETLAGDARAASFAYAAGAVGLLTVLALALMYGVEMPGSRPRVFGPLSDIGSGLFNLLAIPVIVQLHRRLPRSAASGLALAAVIILCVAGAVGSFLLVAKLLPFWIATTASMLALAAQAVWLLTAHTSLLRRGGYPVRLARTGRIVGAAFLVGATIVGLGFLIPAGWAQWVVFGLGGVIGLVGWIGMPVWYLMAARELTGRSSGPGRRAPASSQGQQQ